VPGTAILLSNWRFGVDPLPTIAAPSHNLAVGATGRIMDPDYRSPVTEEFNGGYSWSLSPKSVIEVEYVHVLSLHENKTINVDAKVPINPANVSLGLIRPMDAAFIAAGQPRLGSVRDEQSIGRSRYDGMNISYRQRAFHKIDLSVNYTLARAVGYNEDGGSFRYYPRDPNRPFAPEDFGPAFNDERHHITISGIWNLPWGMSFAPVLQAGSARPYNELSAGNDLGMGGGSAAGALLAPGCTLQGYYSRTCGLNPMDNKRGDPYFNVDTRVAKNIKLGETRKLQLAFQAFNLFNHANYGNNFDNVVGDATFGKPIGFINPTSTVAPRSFTAEFGARFTF
jgi:hypothetical protein